MNAVSKKSVEVGNVDPEDAQAAPAQSARSRVAPFNPLQRRENTSHLPIFHGMLLVMSHSIDRVQGTVAQPAGETLVGLYRRAFAEFGDRALWNIVEVREPTRAQVLAITRQLRTEGNMNARRLAERIERAAALGESSADL